MQDRYAGDFGEYIKLALLRALSPVRAAGSVKQKVPWCTGRRNQRPHNVRSSGNANAIE